MKPGDKAAVWRGTCGQRVMDARMLLSIHGFLSDAETRAVNRRIEKWARKHGFEITRDPLTRATPRPQAGQPRVKRKDRRHEAFMEQRRRLREVWVVAFGVQGRPNRRDELLRRRRSHAWSGGALRPWSADAG